MIVWVLLAAGLVSGFTSCSGGSGSEGDTNPNPPVGSSVGLTYEGPPPATEDVQSFKINVWDNLVADNRCGGCHTQNGPGNGAFVHTDDINLAYQAALPLVDLGTPLNSRMVERLANGHNCWLNDNNACAQIIETYITNWAAETGSIVNTITLTDRNYYEPGNARNFPADSNDFEDLIWDDLLRIGGAPGGMGYCAQCHSEDSATQQQPWFAHADVDTAYDNARDKINLDTPSASRFVTKLRSGHNCWTPSDCEGNANEMQVAIQAFADTITPTQVPDNWNVTGASNLEDDGIEAATGGRIQNNMIANYTFMAPQTDSTGGNAAVDVVYDVSGVNPAADLRNTGSDSGVTWSGSRGIRITEGRLHTTLGSDKIGDLINLTGEYSIETWVAPDNVVQDDSARIVTYSQGVDSSNFILGQTLYNYDFYNRSSVTDPATGGPAYSTPDADEVLQATLQHVVVTFDPINGRRIFVNGRNANPEPDLEPGSGAIIQNWSDGMVMGVGAEPGNDRQWQGVMRMLTIHNRALSEDDIQNNFQLGVGAKFYMMFNLSESGLVDVPRAYIVFEVEVFDGASYLFTNPFFISLDPDWTPGGDDIVIEGMRIGINAKESELGQAYAKLSTTINDASYTETGQTLSRIGTLIPIELGPQSRTSANPGDVFFLTFERIGIAPDDIRDPDPVPDLLTAADIPDLEEVSDIGIKHFHKINEAMSAATGIDKNAGDIPDTFANITRSLPANQAIDEFQPAHQMAIVQLGAEYCLELVESDPGFFDNGTGGSFNINAPADSAFSGDLIDDVIDPLLESMSAHAIAGNSSNHLDTQPSVTESRTVLEDQINDMANPGADTGNIVMAACATVLSSAVMLIQ